MRIANPFGGLEQCVAENVPLARFTWFKIGGPARWLIRPRTVEELQESARRCTDNGIPIYVLGLGANLLVNDNGVNGAVFRLSEDFWRTVRVNDNMLQAGAGGDLQKLLVKTIRGGLAGLECLAGIPGTVGGAVRMNAGGKFGDIGGVVQQVTVMDNSGHIFQRTKDDLVFEYRRTNIVAKFILDITIQLEEDDPHRIMHRTKEIWMYKRNSQPLAAKSAGCIFKNADGQSAGGLIDQAGLKGLRVGGAEISGKHANFIVAYPGCTAADVMKLMKVVHEKVQEEHGVSLEREVEIWP